MARHGVLLALEGVDGCGKSTQAGLLATALRERGLEVVLTCEPTDGPLGQQIREYFQGPTRHLSAKEELNLFMADRREHVEEVINPALAEGKIVITDRYYYSSVAYQGALGLDPDRILAQNEVLAVPPDLTVILTLPVAQALVRLSGTPQRARQVSEEPAYLERVATIYASLKGPQLRHLDASASPEEVHVALLNLTLEFLEAAGRR
jgi:dTMP kinase